MIVFVRNFLLFISLVLIVLLILILIPATPRSSRSLLFSQVQKDSLLVNVNSPRIIFIGGSNLGFGLNSQLIKDSLYLNPINTSVHIGLGLRYMLKHTEEFINKGDIVVVCPEYHHFYGNQAFGEETLLRTLLDIRPISFGKINVNQLLNILPYLPKYATSKLNPFEYFRFKEDVLYSVSSFNAYGDVVAHWNLPAEKVKPYGKIKEQFNAEILEDLKQFFMYVKSKNAHVYLTFPPYQEESYKNIANEIHYIQEVLKQNNIPIIGEPQRYMFADSLFFNSPYHLTKQGADIRTKMLIEDLKVPL